MDPEPGPFDELIIWIETELRALRDESRALGGPAVDRFERLGVLFERFRELVVSQLTTLQAREAETDSRLWEALKAADDREARLQGKLKQAQDREAELRVDLEAARQREPEAERPRRLLTATVTSRADPVEAARADIARLEKKVASLERAVASGVKREADLKAEIESLEQKNKALAAIIGGSVFGDVNIAGETIIKGSPVDLRQCPACGGEGRFSRMENGDRLIILCPNCRGLGKVRL